MLVDAFAGPKSSQTRPNVAGLTPTAGADVREPRCGRRAGLRDLHVRSARLYVTDLEAEASGSRIFEKPAVWQELPANQGT